VADFTAEVFQNEFLPDGGTDVHAVVTITCTGAGAAGQSEDGDAGEIVIVDTSGSMQGDKIIAAQTAAASAIEQIIDGTWFAVIAGTDGASRVFPYPNAETAMVRMEPGARAESQRAVGRLIAGGGTAMGAWLRLAKRIFESVPRVTQRHAILLTDGRNQSEPPEILATSVSSVQGFLQCDCRGVGIDWDVAELRGVATALLGSVDLIPDPRLMAGAFAELMQQAMGRGVAEAQLRVWAPQGAQVLFVRQVSPTVEDLTGRRQDVNALTAGYPTGAWGDESRDYHVAVRLPAKPVGSEQLAARVQLVVRDQTVAGTLVKALWSDDEILTTRINPEVAHYTGQAELAEAIQAGLAARSAGDEATARLKLGRAVQLAEQTGNDDATSRLKKVVEVEDAATGKVALRRDVDRLDEMALDTSSTKTTRVKK
jgi:hypothetical protein